MITYEKAVEMGIDACIDKIGRDFNYRCAGEGEREDGEVLVLRACIEGQAFLIANFITNAVYFLSW